MHTFRCLPQRACKYCHQSFNTIADLNLHMRTSCNSLTCAYCIQEDAPGYSSADLRRHSVVHNHHDLRINLMGLLDPSATDTSSETYQQLLATLGHDRSPVNASVLRDLHLAADIATVIRNRLFLGETYNGTEHHSLFSYLTLICFQVLPWKSSSWTIDPIWWCRAFRIDRSDLFYRHLITK